MAEEAAEGGLNGKDLSRRGGEEAALEDEGGEEEGAGYMHAFKEARVERGPSCCLTNEGPLLVAKGVELQILKGWGDGHPQVPDYLPLPGDRYEETRPKGQSEGPILLPSLLPAPLRDGVALGDAEDRPHRLLVEPESFLDDRSVLGDVGS